MTQRLETRLNPHAPIVLSLFRIFIGLLFLCHGTSLLFGRPADTVAATGSLFWLSGLIELITGILITLGLFMGPAAFIASGEMAVAYFTQHLPHGFWPISNGGELAVMYCWAFFLLVFTGPGAYALDTGFGPRGPGYVRSYLRRSPRSPRTPRRWGRSQRRQATIRGHRVILRRRKPAPRFRSLATASPALVVLAPKVLRGRPPRPPPTHRPPGAAR